MTIETILLTTVDSTKVAAGITIDTSITATAIATIISTIIASIVSYLISRRTFRINDYNKLNDELIRLNTLSIQYPYLEDEHFINGWNEWRKVRKENPTKADKEDTEKYLRYEGYCISFFNFLERLTKFYDYKKSKIELFVQIKEIVRIHAEWWKNPTGEYSNIEGYEKKFRDIVNEYLN